MKQANTLLSMKNKTSKENKALAWCHVFCQLYKCSNGQVVPQLVETARQIESSVGITQRTKNLIGKYNTKYAHAKNKPNGIVFMIGNRIKLLREANRLYDDLEKEYMGHNTNQTQHMDGDTGNSHSNDDE